MGAVETNQNLPPTIKNIGHVDPGADVILLNMRIVLRVLLGEVLLCVRLVPLALHKGAFKEFCLSKKTSTTQQQQLMCPGCSGYSTHFNVISFHWSVKSRSMFGNCQGQKTILKSVVSIAGSYNRTGPHVDFVCGKEKMIHTVKQKW